MSKEPQTSEEYLKLVEEQAQDHEDEEIPSHKEIIDNFESAKRGFHEKQCFYSILLLVVAISYLLLRLFPKELGLL